VIAVLVDRNGRVRQVMLGDADRVYLPDLGRQRGSDRRFRGVRLIRTNLRGDRHNVELSRDDLSDLTQLQLDMVLTISVGPGGYPGAASWAHLAPDNPDGTLYQIQERTTPSELEQSLTFTDFIAELEDEYQRKTRRAQSTEGDPAILVYVATPQARDQETELAEMHELCRTAGVHIVDTFVQRRSELHPKYAVGKGKLEDLTQRAVQLGADLLIFGQDLKPGQLRAITDTSNVRVLDRTQLILDIFAQHATSRDGKLQVELAQLRYNLPRLSDRNTGMSRLMGGIGGRGPGETKLELNKRRARDRMRLLDKAIGDLSKQRSLRRSSRQKSSIPIVSIVGYTNAGKSTLLNHLTSSTVLSEDKLFATLTPTSRKLSFGRHEHLVLTDTVGFIHDLPADLVAAFKSTLEELADADLLLHLIDISDDEFEERIEAVNRILDELELGKKERLLVFNKCDMVSDEIAETLARRYGAIPISALDSKSFAPLKLMISRRLFAQNQRAIQPLPPTPESH
jgi:GTP-binding protein HflX